MIGKADRINGCQGFKNKALQVNTAGDISPRPQSTLREPRPADSLLIGWQKISNWESRRPG
ncbi:MAG: hypothetical protein Tsb009_25380 [Planctomycetaceae bacterium]